MKSRLYALLVLTTTMGLAACSEDPAAAGSGKPLSIEANRSLTSAAVGAKFSLTAFAIDENAQRMEGALQASTTGSNIAIDSVIYVRELLETRIYVNPKTTTATGQTITVTGHSLTKDIVVKVN